MDEDHGSRGWARILGVLLFGFVRLATGTVFSLQAPFYPAEAEKKGLSTLEYGFVFGIYELVTILFVPILDRAAKAFPRRTLFLLGTTMLAASTCVFGVGPTALSGGTACASIRHELKARSLLVFLDRVNGHWEFLVCSIAIRSLEAIGATTAMVMATAAVFQEFPTRMATASAVMETCTSAGMSLGPPIGGMLFELGGFMLPFLAIGIAVSVVTVLGTCVIYQDPPVPDRLDTAKDRPNFLSVLRIPSVLLSYSAIITAMLCVTGMLTILEPYLRMFHLSPVTVSLTFLAYTGTYTLCGLAWGVICDRITNVKLVTLFGLVVAGMGYSCSEPLSNMLGTPQGLVTLGLVLNGVGVSGVCVSSMMQISGGIKKKYPGDESVYTTVCGVLSSAFGLGSFLGPIISGALVDLSGFPSFYYFCVVAHALLIIPYVGSLATGYTNVSKTDESTTLLKPTAKP